MRILVTGADGQLGRALRPVLTPHHETHWTDLPGLDVRVPQAVNEIVRRLQPEAIVHLAAHTRVDESESAVDETFAANSLATRYVALAAREVDAELLFVSTDYVFDGRTSRPYREYDTPAPLNVYGWSKLHGELAVRELVARHYVVRTSGLFAPGGANFVTAILAAQGRAGRVAVVRDQLCRPTYAAHLAAAIGTILGSRIYGILHVASAGATSWFDFARAVVAGAGRDPDTVDAIDSAALARPARRPPFSVLDTQAFEATFQRELPSWRAGLAELLRPDASG